METTNCFTKKVFDKERKTFRNLLFLAPPVHKHEPDNYNNSNETTSLKQTEQTNPINSNPQSDNLPNIASDTPGGTKSTPNVTPNTTSDIHNRNHKQNHSKSTPNINSRKYRNVCCCGRNRNNIDSYEYNYNHRRSCCSRGSCCSCRPCRSCLNSCCSCCCRCSVGSIFGACGSSLFFIVFFSIWFGISGTVFGFGITMIIDGIEYANEATTEQCLLVSKDSNSCSYDCHCTGTGDDRECSTCYSTNYKFYASVEDKCPDILVSYKDNSCPGTEWDVGVTKKCYVLDCKDEEFSLEHYTTSFVVGGILIAVGALFICCGCFACVSFCNGMGSF